MKHWTAKLAQGICVVYVLVTTFAYPPVGLRDRASGNVIDTTTPTDELDELTWLNAHPNLTEEDFARIASVWMRDRARVNASDSTTNKQDSSGYIRINGEPHPITAEGIQELLLLGVSRGSAFSMYPVLIAVFFSKCRGLNNFLRATPFSILLPEDSHDLHSYAGVSIAYLSLLHALCHVLRWRQGGHLSILWEHRTGRTGVVALALGALITTPMLLPAFAKRLCAYKIRKALHYLFFPFAIALSLHDSRSALPRSGYIGIVIPCCILTYFLDLLYCSFCLSERVDTPLYKALSDSGVQITMCVSKRFRRASLVNGGYVYVRIDRISTSEWHPFSIFPAAHDPSNIHIFVQANGDWTRAVRNEVAVNPDAHPPLWLEGPFYSPFTKAVWYDHVIMVASGIGISPVLNCIHQLKDSGRILSLIWITRDRELVRFFLDRLCFARRGASFICFTGETEALPPEIQSLNIGRQDVRCDGAIHSLRHESHAVGSRVRVMLGRPDLRCLVRRLHDVGTVPRTEGKEVSAMRRCGVMYCGGSSEIESALKDSTQSLDVSFHVESFQW